MTAPARCEAETFDGSDRRRCTRPASAARDGHETCKQHARLARVTWDMGQPVDREPTPSPRSAHVTVKHVRRRLMPIRHVRLLLPYRRSAGADPCRWPEPDADGRCRYCGWALTRVGGHDAQAGYVTGHYRHRRPSRASTAA